MKIIKGKYGECRFCDNMNPEFGLPSLEDKSWDLCLTDPPYNVNYKGSRITSKKVITYADNLKDADYEALCGNWYNQFMRIVNLTVITPGNPNAHTWMRFEKPIEMLMHFKPNGMGSTYLSHNCTFDVILCFGKYSQWEFGFKPFKTNVLTFSNQKTDYEHNVPKSYNLWHYLVKQLNPASILDPFLGSGTTAEVCEFLKIPWLGFEVKEEFCGDIEKRIKKGIEKSKQTDLTGFFKHA